MLFDRQTINDPTPAFEKAWFVDKNPLGQTVKRRLLYKPNDAMRQVHEEIIAYVRELRAVHISEQIAPVHLSPLGNVRVHRRARHFYLIDFHHAYEHVDIDRMVKVFLAFDKTLRGRKEDVREFLKRFCFADEGGLATGAPASPDLFNLYVGKLVDEPLWTLLKEHADKKADAARYTRYLDDLTMSLVRNPFGSSIQWRVKQIVKDAGFTLNRKKTKPPLDLKKGPVTITGLRLEWRGRIFVPRHYLERFRNKLREAISNHRFEGDYRIEKMAGMHGVFWSGLDRVQNLTQKEIEILDLWKEYRKLRHIHLERQQ